MLCTTLFCYKIKDIGDYDVLVLPDTADFRCILIFNGLEEVSPDKNTKKI